eukprot:COSAG05_NODE_23966_length_254_cov_1.316129_1_plen_62_part_01
MRYPTWQNTTGAAAETLRRQKSLPCEPHEAVKKKEEQAAAEEEEEGRRSLVFAYLYEVGVGA